MSSVSSLQPRCGDVTCGDNSTPSVPGGIGGIWVLFLVVLAFFLGVLVERVRVKKQTRAEGGVQKAAGLVPAAEQAQLIVPSTALRAEGPVTPASRRNGQGSGH